ECLSGMPIDLEFINFDDIKNGALDQYKVVINAGSAYTSWSGAENWKDQDVVIKIREWVDNGGGFIGVGEPTACQHQGRFFQLSDVLGVDKEIGFTLSHDKYNEVNPNHFLLEDIDNEIDFGEGMDGIYSHGEDYQILRQHHGYSQLVTNKYGKGRSIYFAGLPYSPQNCRLLLRAIYYAAGKEDEMKKYYVSNVNTEVAAFEEVKMIAVINNSTEALSTDLFVSGKKLDTLELKPMELRWIHI
ncbi:MAG: lacto-N-biose phosphorylase central domain-containing protein, partial [Coprobacillus sp.]